MPDKGASAHPDMPDIEVNWKGVHKLLKDGDVPRSPSYGVYISQLICLLECALMLMTSTTVTYF